MADKKQEIDPDLETPGSKADLLNVLQDQVSQLNVAINAKDAEIKKIIDAHKQTKKQLETLRETMLKKNATLNKLADENKRFRNQLGIR